jgi:hypothetical protein
MDKKWNLQDIKPAQRPGRSTRPTAPVAERLVSQTQPSRTEEADVETLTVPIENGRQKRRVNVVVVLMVLVVTFGGIVGVSYLLGGADVTVYPKYREPNINAEFIAYSNPSSPEQLGYEILTLQAEGERQVRATGQQQVTEQATGVITIFKSTPSVQRLITNTRFEGPEGRIYRLVDSVVVPGAVDSQPGSIQAEVFASEAGESYNVPAGTRFTIPGLESDEVLFNAMYATNEAPIDGGFDGLQFVIDEDELATAQQGLREELRDALLEQLPNEQPAGFVTYPGAAAFVYESLPAVEYGDNLATIKERAILHVPLFAEPELAAFLATAAVPGYEDEPVRLDNPDVLEFSYTSATTSSANLPNLSSLSFELEGRPIIVWTYDEGKLATEILGANRTALSQILQAYPGIERAQAEIRPFWQRTFPTDIGQINIVESIGDDDTE